MLKIVLMPLVAALAVALGGIPTVAEEYPTRPVQVIIPFGSGSGSDVIARILFERIGSRINQSFVIENRPAAGGNVGTAAVAKASPDGYTLLFNASGPLTINKTLYKNLPYDPERDFEPISLVAILPNIMVVSAKLAVATVSDFVALAKKNETSLNYSSPGNGTSTHIAGAYFAHIAGLKMTHIPYRSTTQLIGDLIAGEVPLSFLFYRALQAPYRRAKLRPWQLPAHSAWGHSRMFRRCEKPAIPQPNPPGGSLCLRRRAHRKW